MQSLRPQQRCSASVHWLSIEPQRDRRPVTRTPAVSPIRHGSTGPQMSSNSSASLTSGRLLSRREQDESVQRLLHPTVSRALKHDVRVAAFMTCDALLWHRLRLMHDYRSQIWNRDGSARRVRKR